AARAGAERQRPGGADAAAVRAAGGSVEHHAAGAGAGLSDRRRADGDLRADQRRADGGAAGRRRAVSTMAALRGGGGGDSPPGRPRRHRHGALVEPVIAFGPFELDPERKKLRRDGEPVPLNGRLADVLCALVARPGQILTKDQLIEAAWPEVAVTDNSLEQAISALRRLLGSGTSHQYIETQPRRGYRFVAPVTRVDRRVSDAALEAMLAPHRAWIDGRAALEALERSEIARARDVFAGVVEAAPSQAPARVGLANACVMQFEMTRAERAPDVAALAFAAEHAREACRLDPDYGEAWATLGFVLERTGERMNALAALRRAVSLEPDNWRHHVRLSYGSWGEERLRAARRALTLVPGLAMAHWLAATVHVAREAFVDAERDLRAGLEAQQQAAGPFSSVALHWLSGLLFLRRGEHDRALDH